MSKVMAQPMISLPESATPPSAPAQPEEVSIAIARFQAGDPEGALTLLREAAKKDADLSPAQVMMARLCWRANLFPLARDALEKAVREDPADPDAYAMMADIAVRERRVTEAELAYQKAESLLAKFDKSAKRKSDLQPVIYNGLASVAEARDNWAEAQRQLDAWLKVDPDNAAVMQRLARSLVQQKKVTDALEELKKATKADPTGAARGIQRGTVIPEAIVARLCEQAGDRGNAKIYMALALAAAPKDPMTRLAAARWALETEQFDEAQRQVDAAMKLDEKSLEALILRGAIAAFQKDYRTAERYFDAARLQAPENFVASNNLALALVEQKDETKKRRALGYAEENVKRFPKSADAISTYGWVLYKSGRLDEADQALRAAMSGGMSSPDTAYYLARLDVDRNRADEAKMLLKGAMKTPGPFAMRQEAKLLLEQLNK
jgi:tetratricopeptide (TPR) repeat protein